jgi:hypothetical protein
MPVGLVDFDAVERLDAVAAGARSSRHGAAALDLEVAYAR